MLRKVAAPVAARCAGENRAHQLVMGVAGVLRRKECVRLCLQSTLAGKQPLLGPLSGPLSPTNPPPSIKRQARSLAYLATRTRIRVPLALFSSCHSWLPFVPMARGWVVGKRTGEGGGREVLWPAASHWRGGGLHDAYGMARRH